MPISRRCLPAFAATLLLGSYALPALAGPDIDVVYGDEIARRGEVAVEAAARWSQSARSGDLQGRPVWQGVGEIAYGLSDQWNIGLKVPVTRANGSWQGNGAYGEIKYVAPHGAQGFYWGAELEAGSIKAQGEERAFALEAFPILAYRSEHWHVIANPGVEYSAEGEDKGWAFAPKAKLSYRLNELHAIGLEYHIDAGKFGQFTSRSKRSEIAYLTWDAKIAGQQLSIALGHGTTHSSDRWALRIGVEFDD